MKKLFSVLLVALMVMSLAACSETETATSTASQTVTSTESQSSATEENEIVSMINPMTEVESLEVLNEEQGAKLSKPAVMGVTDEKFFTINCGEYTIAQYDFTVNGYEYTYRFSSSFAEDISGIYAGDTTIFANFDGDANASTEEVKAARWFTVDGQYVLVVSDNGEMDALTFDSIAEELKAFTCQESGAVTTADLVAGLVGSYADSFSQRANLTLTQNEDGTAHIEVQWSSSAFEYTYWSMNADFDGYTLSYTDCKEATVNDTAETVMYTDAAGFFEVDEAGNLLWTGAEDDDCVDCVFEKIPE